MILKQYYLGCLAHASYLVGDVASGVAVVVDPQRDIDQYLHDAAPLGISIRHVFLTHFHADFVAGHIELRQRTGARIHLGAQAQAEYDFIPLHDGEQFQFGQLGLRILATPGHTPEGVSILVLDGERPHAVLTGDTLFIGDVGRPDLLAAEGYTAAELAGLLYDSLHGKLLTLPDDTLVYPAHGAGSMCGKNLSSEKVSTIGQQRQFNYACQPMPRQAFIDLITADQPQMPAYFAHDAALNRGERPTLEQALQRALQPLSLPAVLDQVAAGAQVLDVREAAAFAAGYLRGSVNIGLSGKFAHWAGELLDRERPIILVAEPGREREAALRLGRIGFDHVMGYLQEGTAALASRADLVETIQRIQPADLRLRLAAPEPPLVVDVRNDQERQCQHIAGSIHLPLPRLRARVGELPRDRPLVIHCAGGYRSSTAASLLAQLGIRHLQDLVGGMSAWEKAS